jgi:hypothetical protein
MRNKVSGGRREKKHTSSFPSPSSSSSFPFSFSSSFSFREEEEKNGQEEEGKGRWEVAEKPVSQIICKSLKEEEKEEGEVLLFARFLAGVVCLQVESLSISFATRTEEKNESGRIEEEKKKSLGIDLSLEEEARKK